MVIQKEKQKQFKLKIQERRYHVWNGDRIATADSESTIDNIPRSLKQISWMPGIGRVREESKRRKARQKQKVEQRSD